MLTNLTFDKKLVTISTYVSIYENKNPSSFNNKIYPTQDSNKNCLPTPQPNNYLYKDLQNFNLNFSTKFLYFIY